jgi:outer membrane protein OmpA-like peptidoglycan-associated protein
MPANLSDDRNQISLEPHELDYVLQKWSKAASIGNRSILAGELRKFKADPAWAPHNRISFYRYADEQGIKQLLADKESRTGLSGQNEPDHPYTVIRDWTAPSPVPQEAPKNAQAQAYTSVTPSPKPAAKAGKRRALFIFLIFLALIAIAACMFFLFYGKPEQATPVAEKAAEATTDPKAGLALQFKQTVRENSPVLFIADQEFWLPGQEAKMDAIVKAMQGLSKIGLTVTGHTADASMPGPQLILSNERALAVKNYLVEKSGTTGLSVTAKGVGAANPVITDVPLSEQQANRRVDITVDTAE